MELTPDRESGSGPGPALGGRRPPGLPALVGAALWAGLVAGFVELGVFVARAQLTQHGLYRKSPHFLWTIPLVNLGIFGAVALLAAPVRLVPRVGARLSCWLLCLVAVTTPLLSVPGLRAASCLALAAGVACWLEPALHARPGGFRRLVRSTLPPLGLAVLILGGVAFGRARGTSRGRSDGGPAPPRAPNVLLIVMDTVRADATSPYGSARDTTPHLAALARRGARFERAVATAPWTLPSHASMFTGRWPWELAVGPDRPLDGRFPTLAAYLGRHGYATAGFAANTVFCTREYGLGRGFGHYEDFDLSPLDAFRSSALGWLVCRRLAPLLDDLCAAAGRDPAHPLDLGFHRKDAATINRAALRWVEGRGDRPFFLFLNYFDAHDPYLVPPGAGHPHSRRPPTLAERRTLRDWIGEAPRDRTPRELRLARDAYDDCLSSLDGAIGRFLAGLDRLGRLRDTVVLVTSDHGEHFGEHSRNGLPLVGHRQSVYQPEVHVPLLIAAPGRIAAGAVVPEAVSLRDLPATVVDLVGLRAGSPFPGRSLVSLTGPGGAGPDRGARGFAFAEFSTGQDEPAGLRYRASSPALSRVVITDGTSYHRHGDGREEVYDLRADPRERTELTRLGRAPADLDPYRRLLDRLAAPPGSGAAAR